MIVRAGPAPDQLTNWAQRLLWRVGVRPFITSCTDGRHLWRPDPDDPRRSRCELCPRRSPRLQ